MRHRAPRAAAVLRCGFTTALLSASASILIAGCDSRQLPPDIEGMFQARVVTSPYRMPSVPCTAAPGISPTWRFPLRVLAIDTRRCQSCATDLRAPASPDTTLAAWMVVVPDSAIAEMTCRRFSLERVFVVARSLWTYDSRSGVVRWYDKSSPASSEFRGGYRSMDAALAAIHKALRTQ